MFSATGFGVRGAASTRLADLESLGVLLESPTLQCTLGKGLELRDTFQPDT